MPSIAQMMSRVRGRLRTPLANRPSDGDVLREVCSHSRIVSKSKRNAGAAWDYTSLVLTVDAGEAEYLITDRQFGRPFSVITRDDGNPSHVQRSIDFFEPQNLNFDWGLPNDVGSSLISSDGSYHTALGVAFYRRDGRAYMRVQPTPQFSCDYEIFYTQRDAYGQALSAVPGDESACDLIEIRASRSLLPLTAWEDDEKENRERRKELAATLTADESLQREQFDAESLAASGPRITQRWMPPIE